MKTGCLIIGGGPAGLTAACFFGPGAVLADRLPQVGRKLLATGGGRCNLTHETGADGIMEAFGRNARFMRPALSGFPPAAVRAFFSRLGVATLADDDGCVFPVSRRASDVAGALERAARAAGAEIRCGTRVLRLLTEKLPGDAAGRRRVTAVETESGLLRPAAVILAAGGQSYPDLGSDGSGFRLARQAGLEVVQPVPALAGLVTREEWPKTLAGIVLEHGGMRLEEVKGTAGRMHAGPLLFTHKGLSGPPALNCSGEIAARLRGLGGPAGAAAPPTVPVRVCLDTRRGEEEWARLFAEWRSRKGGRALHNLLSGEMPRALAVTLCGLSGARDVAAARAGKQAVAALAAACCGLRLHITGTEGWGRAMVTRGGVALKELEPATLACRNVVNLFCAGEIADLDGWCGGYNLTWAFASGRLAGRACAVSLSGAARSARV